MEQRPRREGISRQRSAATLRNHSSRSDEVAEKMSKVPHPTAKHCQDKELEKTEGRPCKKNIRCFKERSSSKNPEKNKGRWSSEEDEILTQMVNKHGLNNWQTVARAIPDRNAQQCRMRWKNSLDPAVNKEAWSEQEELRLIRAHQLYGNKWVKMVKHFPGRTNCTLKEHWRGPMKRKLDSYLASGLLEQVPDLHDDISALYSSQSDILKDNADLSEKKQTSLSLATSPKSKQLGSDRDKNADSSGGECSDFTFVKWRAHAAEVSERIIAKSKERATARKKLDFLSTPVELKVCTATGSSQSSLPKMKQMNPTVDSISPADVSQDDPPNAPSEFVDTVLSAATGNHSKDVGASENPEPSSLDIPDESALDLLDMSYCDDLMMDLPSYPHGSSFI